MSNESDRITIANMFTFSRSELSCEVMLANPVEGGMHEVCVYNSETIIERKDGSDGHCGIGSHRRDGRVGSLVAFLVKTKR